MRTAQFDWPIIADKLGISPQLAMHDYARAIKDSVRVPAEKAIDEHRAIVRAIVRANYQDAMNRNSDNRFPAQAKILDALTHEAKLVGLYAPARVNVGISAEEMAQRAAELLKVVGTAPLLELARPVLDATVDAEVVEAPPEDDDDDELPWSNL